MYAGEDRTSHQYETSCMVCHWGLGNMHQGHQDYPAHENPNRQQQRYDSLYAGIFCSYQWFMKQIH